jgi:hypothetical protein
VNASFLPPLVATADDAVATGAFIDEVRHSFTLNGKPIPPEILRDFGDGDLAGSGSIWVTVDVKAAIGSNLYFDGIKQNGSCITVGSSRRRVTVACSVSATSVTPRAKRPRCKRAWASAILKG